MPAHEERDQIMAAWTNWFGQLGGALVDRGNPASRTRTISADGSVRDEAAGPTGYSILKADSIEQAVGLSKGCPVLTAPSNSVQVVGTFEAM